MPVRRILEHGVDHVRVVGIAGGVDQNVLKIGDVIMPETVVGRAMRRSFRPFFVGDIAPNGTLSCGDDLITDPAGLTVVVQPNVVTRDGRAGVQTGELLLVTEQGPERLHAYPPGLQQLR